MHLHYVRMAIVALALELLLAIVWFVFLTMSFANDSPYELTMFLSGLHFLGSYLVFVVARKLYKKERISYSMYTYICFFTIIAFICIRNFYHAWYILPLRILPGTPAPAVIVIDQFQTMLKAITTTALILSGLELIWFVALASHQFKKDYYVFKKENSHRNNNNTPGVYNFVLNIPENVLRGLKSKKYETI